jgi:YHS domain-containing protein
MSIDRNQIINADPHGRITLQGHDPVAFHVDGKAVKGEPTIAADYLGYTYLFTSDANKAVFEEQPEKYLPVYGGYCAYGVSLDVLAPVEIDTWEIIDGRLYLQFSRPTKEKFTENQDECILKASENWERIRRERLQAIAS